MNQKKQEKTILVKIIEFAMDIKGWGVTDLDRKANLPKGKGSKLISGHKGKPAIQFGLNNLYKILTTLDLLKRYDEANKQAPESLFSVEALSQYKFLGKIDSEAKEALERGLPMEGLIDAIMKEMEKEREKLGFLKKTKSETGK